MQKAMLLMLLVVTALGCASRSAPVSPAQADCGCQISGPFPCGQCAIRCPAGKAARCLPGQTFGMTNPQCIQQPQCSCS